MKNAQDIALDILKREKGASLRSAGSVEMVDIGEGRERRETRPFYIPTRRVASVSMSSIFLQTTIYSQCISLSGLTFEDGFGSLASIGTAVFVVVPVRRRR